MREGGGGHSTGGEVYDSATTICAKTFTTCITVTVPIPNALAADVFGAGNYH